MRLPRLLTAALGAAAIGAAPAAADTFNVQVVTVQGANAVYSPCGIGGQYTFPAIPGAAMGDVWQVDVDMRTTPWTVKPIKKLGTACPAGSAPGLTPGPGQTFGPLPGMTPGAGGSSGGGPSGGSGDDDPMTLAAKLPASAFNKVVTFTADADGFGDGELSVTFLDVKGITTSRASLVSRFGAVLEEQDGLVLVGKTVHITNRAGRRVKRSDLDDADRVSVKGKLLKPKQWHDDEDGNPVPTVRAKRVTILR